MIHRSSFIIGIEINARHQLISARNRHAAQILSSKIESFSPPYYTPYLHEYLPTDLPYKGRSQLPMDCGFEYTFPGSTTFLILSNFAYVVAP